MDTPTGVHQNTGKKARHEELGPPSPTWFNRLLAALELLAVLGFLSAAPALQNCLLVVHADVVGVVLELFLLPINMMMAACLDVCVFGGYRLTQQVLILRCHFVT